MGGKNQGINKPRKARGFVLHWPLSSILSVLHCKSTVWTLPSGCLLHHSAITLRSSSRLHLGLAVALQSLVVVVVLLADELVRLLVGLLQHHRVPPLQVFTVQLMARQMLHDPGADRVSQHVSGRTQPVSAGNTEREGETFRKENRAMWDTFLVETSLLKQTSQGSQMHYTLTTSKHHL